MGEPQQSRRSVEHLPMAVPPPRIEAEVMDGRWYKTSDKPQWIERLELDTVDDVTYVHIFGGASPSPADWGRVRIQWPYASASNTSSAKAGGFVAQYDFDEMSVEVQANYNLGLLVVATFVTFKQPGALSDRFTREFFFRA
ncbi:MAG: hypothetical protein JWO97_4097 [Acidobacteria bacterium]|nr:hypothetical protein [Acidobacteriota bacterium]